MPALSAILQLADGILTSLTPPSEDTPSRSVSLDTIDAIIDAAQTITLCAQHQKCIVDDILTLSKLDSSLLVITPDRVQPPVLIEKALKMYDAELDRTQIEASLEVHKSYDDAQLDLVMLDPSRLLCCPLIVDRDRRAFQGATMSDKDALASDQDALAAFRCAVIPLLAGVAR